MKKIILLISIFFCTLFAEAQVVPKYNLYNQNLFLINPAATGVNSGVTAFFGYKDQWSGFKDAPQNSYFSVDGLITNSMGLGLIVNQQKMGIFKMSNIGVNYAYRIGFSSTHAIAFGMSVNFLQNKLNTEGLYAEELTDPTLFSNKFDETLFSNSAGIEYRLKGLSVELSTPLLYSYQEQKLFQTSYMYLAYDFYFGGDVWRLQPSTLLRYTHSSPFQTDINILFDWNRIAWGQVTYRTNKEVLFCAGVFIKYIGIGYAYEMNMKPVSFASSGSHEIVIFFNTPFSISKKEPLYFDSKRRSAWN